MTYANLVSGNTFNENINKSAIGILRAQSLPTGVTTTNISSDNDNSIVTWYDADTENQYIYTAADKIYMNKNMSNCFYECRSLTSLDLSYFDTSKVTNMNRMFEDCSSLTSLDVSNFDTSNVTDMNYMFSNTHMTITYGDTFIAKESDDYIISDYGRGTIDYYIINPTEGMFSMSTSTKPNWVGQWSFYGSYIRYAVLLPGPELNKIFNKDAVRVSGMMETTVEDLDLIKYPLHTISTDDSIGVIKTYFDTSDNTQYIVSTNNRVIANEDMSYTFSGMTKLEYIEMYEIDYVLCKNISNSCSGCTSLRNYETLINMDTRNVEDMSNMFKDCTTLSSIYIYNDPDNGQYFSIAGLVNASGMFSGCTNINSMQLIFGIGPNDLRDLSHMFENCSSLVTIDGGMFTSDMEMTSNMEYMFAGCSLLESIDISRLSTSNVVDMSGLFKDCSSLTSISYRNNGPDYYTPYFIESDELLNTVGSSSDASNKTYQMFYNCTAEKPNIQDNFYWSDDGTLLQNEQPVDPPVKMSSRIWINGKDHIACKYTNQSTPDVVDNINTIYMGGDKVWSIYKLDVPDIPEDLTGVLVSGKKFREAMDNYTSYMVRSNTPPSSDITTIFDLSELQDKSIVGWNVDPEYTFYIYSEIETLYLNPDSSEMFKYLEFISNFDMTIYGFDTSRVTNMRSMFEQMSRLVKLNISNFDTSNVTDMAYMIGGPDYEITYGPKFVNTKLKYLECDGSINGSYYMCTTSNKPDWTDGTWNENGTFVKMRSFQEGSTMFVHGAYISNNIFNEWNNRGSIKFIRSKDLPTDSAITPVDISYAKDNSIVTWHDSTNKIQYWHSNADIIYINDDCSYMFFDQYAIESTDISELDASYIVCTASMFYRCSSLTSLDLSKWNTPRLIDTTNMFLDCENLTSLDLSNFDMRKVEKMQEMFNGTALTNIVYGSNFVISTNTLNKCVDNTNTNPTYRMFYNIKAPKPDWVGGTWDETGTFIKS